MSDRAHNHLTRDIKPEGVCPGCDQLAEDTRPKSPVTPGNDLVHEWGERVADDGFVLGNTGCCFICGDLDNHGEVRCPTGVTRTQAYWVRRRREVGLGPAWVQP